MDELTHVACIEDDRSIRMIIELALSEIGNLKVSLFPSGQEALEKISTHAPQMIVLDMMMPDMDGLETLARLRKLPETSNTPAIFMTAKAQPAEIDLYRKMGAIDVVVKPFNPMTLAESLKEIWHNYNDHRDTCRANAILPDTDRAAKLE